MNKGGRDEGRWNADGGESQCEEARICVWGATNDRLICVYQQRRRWEAYSCFLMGARIILYHHTPECNATGTTELQLGDR